MTTHLPARILSAMHSGVDRNLSIPEVVLWSMVYRSLVPIVQGVLHPGTTTSMRSTLHEDLLP